MRARAVGGQWLAPAVLPVAVLAGLLVARHPRTVYTSDSTAQQSIVRTWLDVGHGITYVPPDTWWLKAPLYLLLESLPLSPSAKLLAAVLVLNVATFLLLGLAARMLAPRARWHELAGPLLWLAALGGGIGSNRMLPNYRNIELGLIFVLLALVARYLGPAALAAGPSSPARLLPRVLKGAGVAVALGLFWVDDPYFALLVAAPLAALAVLWFRFRPAPDGRRDPRLLRLAAVLLVSLACTAPLHLLMRAFGVHVGDNGKTLAGSLAAVWQHVLLLPPGVGIQLGVNRWDDGFLAVLAQLLLLASLAAMLVAATLLAVHGWRRRLIVPFFVGLHWPLVIAGFLASWYAQDIRTSRYLVLIVYDVAIAGVMALPLLRARRPRASAALAGLVAVAAVLGAATGAATAIDADRRPSTALNAQREVLRAVESVNVQKGYAPFWAGNINSYLAGGGRTTVELVCSNRRLATRQWLSDTARLTRPAGRSFLIWVPAAVTLRGCNPQMRDAQLGRPERTITTSTGTQVLVYPYDIAPRLPAVVSP